MSNQYQFEELKSGNGPEFEEFYSIYADSISARERKSKAWISEMAGRTDYKILLLKRDGHVIGFCVLFLPSSETFGLLEYMAVADAYRNGGLGSELFRRSVQAAAEAYPKQPVPLLLEVDSDREKCADQTLRRRRQQFYRRLGCLTVSGLRYNMPLSGEGPPPEMDLLIYPSSGRRQIPKAELERWLKTIYQSVYHCSPQDPRIQQMMRSMADPVQFA
ncbi:MAG TPA: GNAT family N-acetyltransferase [Candidatus Angelobacter sp.]|nr:GNAT family N-acetyltransferase [Candidatus Angelobacter sp.]